MSDKFKKTLKESEKVLKIFRDKPIKFLRYTHKDFTVQLERLSDIQTPQITQKEQSLQVNDSITETVNLHTINAKYVGLFKATKIIAGAEVAEGDIIGNIFSMNINHPVKVDKAGVIEEFIVAENDPVDYGAPIATIK